MPNPDTMKVRSKAFPNGEVINTGDFNPSKHKRMDDPEPDINETPEQKKEREAAVAESKKAEAENAKAEKDAANKKAKDDAKAVQEEKNRASQAAKDKAARDAEASKPKDRPKLETGE